MANDVIVYLCLYVLPLVIVLSIGAPEIQITPRFKILASPAAGRARRVFLELTAMNLAILIFLSLALTAPPLLVPLGWEIVYGLFARSMGPYLE